MNIVPGSPLEIREIQKNMTVLRVDKAKVYASRGYEIFCSADGGETWELDGLVRVPAWRRGVDSIPSLRQVSRGGVSRLILHEDGTRLCVLPGMIARAEAGSSEYECVFQFPRGSRPLNLCRGSDGAVYWGEYFLNLRRSQPVHIYGSNDGGRSWGVVYTFPKGSICHVHRIAVDPYEDAYLICTGDRDREVSILRTTDGFRTVTPLVQGDQRYRTTSLMARTGCLLYGTDNPNGENSIMALDRRTGRVEKIQELPGPVLFGCQVGDHTVFATMVEKQHHEVSLWAGNGNGFTMLAHLKSKKWNRPLRELAGYPTVVLPEGTGSWPYLYFTPLGTKHNSQSLMRMDLSQMLNKNA